MQSPPERRTENFFREAETFLLSSSVALLRVGLALVKRIAVLVGSPGRHFLGIGPSVVHLNDASTRLAALVR